jgi:hypothetical protein
MRAVRLSDARRASETGLVRRREEYRGGGIGPAGAGGNPAPGAAGEIRSASPNPGGDATMNQAGDRIRLGAVPLYP